jgi:hypothetical protein
MSRRALRLALRLYPRRWCDARGDELEQLTEDLLADPGERPWLVVMSTAVGALREQARPTYLTGGRLVGLGLTGAGLAAAGLALAFLVGRGPGVDLIPASAQSTGRLATLTGMEAVLDTQRVRVTVNGVTVPLPEIAGRSIGFEGSAAAHIESVSSGPDRTVPTGSTVELGPDSVAAPVFRFSPLVAVKRAIAYEVLTELTAKAAERDGYIVSLSAARAFAEKEYAAWLSHPVALPRRSPPVVFLSAGAVAAYRQDLTMQKEITVIAGPPGDGDRTPALRRWMTGQLARTTVVIAGVPGLTPGNLAASLPPNL